MFDSELVHQSLVIGESSFCCRPRADGFGHGFDADQAIPDSRIGWHEVAAFGRQRNQVGLVDAGGEFWRDVELLANVPPDAVLEVLVSANPLLEWPSHVTHVRLGGIVEQGCELVLFRHQLGDDAAVLGHAVELAGVAVEAAQVGQRVRDVPWVDHVGVGLEQVEALACGGEDPVHAASPLSSKRSISAAMFSAFSRRASV